MEKYHQLTRGQRYQIQALIALEMKPSEMARSLCVHRSTIGREILRNSLEAFRSTELVYDANSADGTSKARRREGCESRWKITGALKNYVHKKLNLDWSPEQIAGRLHYEQRSHRIGTCAIYRYIARSFEGEAAELHKRLRRYSPRRRNKKRQKRKPPGYGYPRLSHRERPEEANRRTRVGDFERDLMEGLRSKEAVLVFVDRKTRKMFIEKVIRRNSKNIQAASIKILKKRVKSIKVPKTITNDNGHEFIYSKIPNARRELGVPVYFTDPSSPWQRGTVENSIGLLRQYFPKSTDLTNVPERTISWAEELLNNRPRKVLDFMTPNEVYKSELKKLS